MKVAWGLFTILSLVYHTEARCSPTTYYKDCWIRRFPGIFIDIEESQRRGAQLLKSYQEETALKCSRTCCLTRNFSCNLALFHYDTIQENVNCFHLHCATLESCILSHRVNVVLYNISKGVDPDLLVFGKYFTSNVRVLPHLFTRGNASEPLASDKRQFNRPPLPPVQPLTPAPTVEPPATESPPSTPGTVAATTTTASLRRTAQPTATTSSVDPVTGAVSSQPLPVPVTTSITPLTLTTSTDAPYTPQTIDSFTSTTEDGSGTITQPIGSSTAPQPRSPSTSTGLVANTGSSPQQHNDSQGYSGRNHSSDGGHAAGGEDGTGGVETVWPAAAHTLLVTVAACVTVLLCCCCTMLLAVSWRGHRNRKGHYRTTCRGKGGSMRLIKYVLVRESSWGGAGRPVQEENTKDEKWS